MSWTTNICRYPPPERSSAWISQHTQSLNAPRLTHRIAKAPPPPPPQIKTVQTIIRHTVTPLLSVTHCHIRHHALSIQHLHSQAFLILPPPLQGKREETLDPARPTRTAQRLLRLFSVESAQRQLRPFYSSIVRRVLKEEQERYQSRPTQAISLIWNLFGRQQAFRTLTRFYFSAAEKLGSNYYPALHGQNALYLAAGVVLHSRVYQRYVRQFWSRERADLPLRYTHQAQAMTDDLVQLQVRRQVLPPREPLEEIARTQQEERPPRELPQAQTLHLSPADFRALVQGVASSLGRQARVDTLRRGGI